MINSKLNRFLINRKVEPLLYIIFYICTIYTFYNIHREKRHTYIYKKDNCFRRSLL